MPIAEPEPIVRIANTIIMEARRKSASEIKLDFLPAESVTSYLIAGIWHEEMRVPGYINPPLIERFRTMADLEGQLSSAKEEGMIPIRCDNKDYLLGLTHTRTDSGEQMLIRFM